MLSQQLKNRNIILASGSPRRQYFLEELGIVFEIRLNKVYEVYPKHLVGSEITDYLAKLKAAPFKKELQKEDILITSDTIVWLENKAIGKPKTHDEAKKMLGKLSGKTHKVISSICLTTTEKQTTFNDTTLVKFKVLKEAEIEYYINKYKPFDKAGGYGIQEWIGYIGIEQIQGSYFNVMGFPTHKFYQEILKF
ncbi:MAG: Maf-like protein [Flavobacteriaceae bacterium]|nr:Maf-like protein [Flavobacteriaceae bacterium]